MKPRFLSFQIQMLMGVLFCGSTVVAKSTIPVLEASDSLKTHELGIYVGALPAVALGSNMGIQPNGVLYRKGFRKGALRLGAQIWFPQTSNSPVQMLPTTAGDSTFTQKRREERQSQIRAFVGWEWNGELTQWARWIVVADAQFRYGWTNKDVVESTYKLSPNATQSLVDDPPVDFISRQTIATQRRVEIGGGMSFGAGIRIPLGKRFTLHTLTRANVNWQVLKQTETGLVGILPVSSFSSSAISFDFLMPMAELGVSYRF